MTSRSGDSGQVSDRVTNKQLYDELSKIPTRRELYLIVCASSSICSAITAAITHLTPPQQAQHAAIAAIHLIS